MLITQAIQQDHNLLCRTTVMLKTLADGEGVVGAMRQALGGVIVIQMSVETVGGGTVKDGEVPQTTREQEKILGGEALRMLGGVLTPALQQGSAVKTK